MKQHRLLAAIVICLNFSYLANAASSSAFEEKKVKNEAEERVRAQGISFRDYYRKHKEEVDNQVKGGTLNLSNKNLTDLTDFDADHIPGLTALRVLYLFQNQLTILSPAEVFKGLTALRVLDLDKNQLIILPAGVFNGLTALQLLYLYNNQLTTLPAGVFNGLTALRALYLYNNPIPLDQRQLAEQLKLPVNVNLQFKMVDQEAAEKSLMNATKKGEVDIIRQEFKKIVTSQIKTYRNVKIDISKIRDAQGNNLLHLVVKSFADKRNFILNSPLWKGDFELLSHEIKKNDDTYTKIFWILTQFGGPKVQEMLLTRNKSGQDVIQQAIGLLGMDSGIIKAIKDQLAPKAAGKPMPRFAMKRRADEITPAQEEEGPILEEITEHLAAQRAKILKEERRFMLPHIANKRGRANDDDASEEEQPPAAQRLRLQPAEQRLQEELQARHVMMDLSSENEPGVEVARQKKRADNSLTEKE